MTYVKKIRHGEKGRTRGRLGAAEGQDNVSHSARANLDLRKLTFREARGRKKGFEKEKN